MLLVESESLLNDGAAAVLFVMALAWAQSAGHAQASLEMVTTLVRIVLGGVIIGAAFGGVTILVAKRTSEHLIEAALTTVTAYGSFLAAEYFDVSGVLATVTAGLTIGVAKGALIHTDEYDIYARLPAWGYEHKTVCHGRGEYARDEDGDGFHEIHVNTMEGFWSLLRSWLRPHRGVAQEKLPLYLAFFQFVHNARKRGRALLTALVEAIVAPSPRNPG